MDEYLTSEQAGAILKVSRQTIKNLFDRGHFPNAYKIDPTRPNSPFRIPRTDIDAYIAKYRPKTKPVKERSPA